MRAASQGWATCSCVCADACRRAASAAAMASSITPALAAAARCAAASTSFTCSRWRGLIESAQRLGTSLVDSPALRCRLKLPSPAAAGVA